MKKSLLALAAMGAFAGAAQAQSSVTVYGIIDAGFQNTNAKTPLVGAGGQQLKTTTNSFNAIGGETTSRLGFRGTEDLGGGTSAFFTLEMQLNPADSTSYTAMINRQSFVGLAQKGIGRFAIGTQYTPVHLAVGATDPGQQNNTPGNVIYSVNSTTQMAGQTAAYTVRQNNALTLQSDRFAGFQAYGMYANNGRDTTQVAPSYTSVAGGGNTNVSSWGLGINYTWQKLYATVVYQSLKNETDSALPAQTTVVATSGTNNNGTNVTSNQTYAGLTYDFGILKAYLQWAQNKTTSNINSNDYLKRTAQQIGVRGNITKTIEGWASIGNGKFDAFGQTSPTVNFTGYQLGANYWLSKRTNLYGIYGQTQSTSSNVNVSGLYTAGLGAAFSGYSVGVRHTF